MNRNQLKMLLDREGFDPRCYSLDDGLSNDTLCISNEAGRWCVYYTERGRRFDERWFDDENEACEYLLLRLRRLPPNQTRLPGR
jgi:hypothetical protein